MLCPRQKSWTVLASIWQKRLAAICPGTEWGNADPWFVLPAKINGFVV